MDDFDERTKSLSNTPKKTAETANIWAETDNARVASDPLPAAVSATPKKRATTSSKRSAKPAKSEPVVVKRVERVIRDGKEIEIETIEVSIDVPDDIMEFKGDYEELPLSLVGMTRVPRNAPTYDLDKPHYSADDCELCPPYQVKVDIVTDPLTGNKIETITQDLRGLIDNYSNVFRCLFARFYETLLIGIFKYIDIDVLIKIRGKLSDDKACLEKFEFNKRKVNIELADHVEKSLQAVQTGKGLFKEICERAAAVSELNASCFEDFGREMATVELRFIYASIKQWERYELQDRIIREYAADAQRKCTSGYRTIADYNLQAVLDTYTELEKIGVLD